MNTLYKPMVLGFYGDSASGKTTLIERLVDELKSKNFHIAVVKISGQPISLDSNGKDTDRFSKAGAEPVVFITTVSTTYLFHNSCDEVEVINNLQQMAQLDYIFIEGSRDKNIPKIRLGERELRANTLFSYDGNFVKLFNFIIRSFEKEI